MESLKVGSRKKPAYIKIKEIIREQIFSSHGKAHFLSESQIIGDFRVSATTARKVLDELQNEGLVERKVGKGSFGIPSYLSARVTSPQVYDYPYTNHNTSGTYGMENDKHMNNDARWRRCKYPVVVCNATNPELIIPNGRIV